MVGASRGNSGNTGSDAYKGVYIFKRTLNKNREVEMISSVEKPFNQTMFSPEHEQLLVKPHEIILQNIRENGLYRVNYSFNGRLSEPKNVGKLIKTFEKDLKLLREGVKREPQMGGFIFSVLVYDRETVHKLYLFLLSHRARVKVERLNCDEKHFAKIQEKILRSLLN